VTLAVAPAPARTTLEELLAGLARTAPPRLAIGGLSADSRAVAAGDLFLACAGRRAHGLLYAEEAVRAGAVAVAWEPIPGLPRPRLPVPVLEVADLGRRLGTIADRFHAAPSAALAVCGVTGTNGKTSCAHFVAQAASALGKRCGVLGTLGAGFLEALEPAALTTPDALAVHGTLARLRDRGARAVAMEVSSHALDQGRADAVRFDVAVLTNLSRDHLDYHGDMRAYAAAKARLFCEHAPRAAVLNCGDAFGRALVAQVRDGTELLLIAPQDPVPARARWLAASAVESGSEGLRVAVQGSWGACELRSPLLGAFNADNLLAALAVALAWGFDLEDAAGALARVTAPPGRMERFGGGTRLPLVIVDYAHSPDALAKALAAARAHCRGELWCVFGCGGERDAGKRPVMGAVAEAHAERVIVTDDNPRGEDPAHIVAGILAGLRRPERVLVERDRRAAITRAVRGARAGDVVLVAGKGHEDYQILGPQRVPFSDRALVAALVEPSP
jgi:UDP-N-acetylmuramoyl-L-alanyl-D-glutamate--2,6-diaminopimelate ligase